MPDEIAAFWRAFAAIDWARKGLDDALTALVRVDKRLRCHIGHKPIGQDFFVSLEGHCELGELAEHLVAAGPPLPGWRYDLVFDSSLLLRQRNYDLFPDDALGHDLYTHAKAGDCLWKPRPCTFGYAFPNAIAARRFHWGLPAPFKERSTMVSATEVDAVAVASASYADFAAMFAMLDEVAKGTFGQRVRYRVESVG